MYAIAIDDFKLDYSTRDEQIQLKKQLTESLSAQIKIDKKLSSMGNIAIVITNVEKFIDQLKRRCPRLIGRGHIDYFDENRSITPFQDIRSIFRKRKKYEYQKEYRFVFHPVDRSDSEIFYIGDLKEIAFKSTLHELEKSISILIK
jgi:hypothetical protein